MAGKKLINRWEATFVVSWHLFQRWQYVWETCKLFLLCHSKYLFQPWDGSGRGPWGSGDAPSWSQTAPGSSGGGQGEGRPTLTIWYSNLNFQFPGRKRKGCFDLWRWFWAWALLCRIHRWDGNVCTNAKKIKTLADLRFNLGNEKKVFLTSRENVLQEMGCWLEVWRAPFSPLHQQVRGIAAKLTWWRQV